MRPELPGQILLPGTASDFLGAFGGFYRLFKAVGFRIGGGQDSQEQRITRLGILARRFGQQESFVTIPQSFVLVSCQEPSQ